MDTFRAQRETLKSAATTLKRAEIPFALAGGYAAWARGGPESTHDVDFVVQPDDSAAALAALAAAGHDLVDAPEDWLAKVRRDGVTVDVIHRLPMGDVDERLLSRTDDVSVDSVKMPVLSATDLLLSRLLALTDHSCDLSTPLAWSRSFREQVDWDTVERVVGDNPFGQAFLGLVGALGIRGGGDGER
ncbi:MAG TPA: nucleotidyltransferase family protein [Nocardioides sp.]|nr:nucleotidyltransferase family protein [Nocardioides sp.]